MAGLPDIDPRTALDNGDLHAIRLAARQNQPAAISAAARQIEAMFANMLLKSMRAATPQEGIFDSEQSRMVTAMLDQKLSESLARRGIGLADALTRQLSNNAGLPVAAATPMDSIPGYRPATTIRGAAPAQVRGRPMASQLAAYGTAHHVADTTANRRANGAVDGAASRPVNAVDADPLAPLAASAAAAPGVSQAGSKWTPASRSASIADHVRAFRDKLTEHAMKASELTGIPAHFMLGQAALESGWGRREITAADGSNSFNLFGVKAGANWSGPVAQVQTTEYLNGVPEKRIEKFRVYESYGAAFHDYARLLTGNPRYRGVLESARDVAAFAHGLQKAGYATDPHYAQKLISIIKHRLGS